ncbi:hypothetical protein E4U16_003383 [Claviceps sp. LM84 group G4]|nr:hypothetical protein E4U33_003769 [Claviceps sp. LM78 group G4]KAG6075389.1 hypothetical protein E4U16_003383 [Claviceps sp. LM84 group G4]
MPFVNFTVQMHNDLGSHLYRLEELSRSLHQWPRVGKCNSPIKKQRQMKPATASVYVAALSQMGNLPHSHETGKGEGEGEGGVQVQCVRRCLVLCGGGVKEAQE